VNAFKFLTAGAVGLHSGFRWPAPGNGEPGEWVAIEGSLLVGSRGVHACRAEALVEWLDEELWEVELGGELTEAAGVVVGSRGRLLRRLPEWDGATAQDLAEACVWRIWDHAAGALRRLGLAEVADELGSCRGLKELQTSAHRQARHAKGFAAQALAYVADAVQLAGGGRPEAYGSETCTVAASGPIAANLAFVSAVAAGAIAADAARDPDAFEPGFEEERAWQRGWLFGRLGLEP
jgi:hypothetical protein